MASALLHPVVLLAAPAKCYSEVTHVVVIVYCVIDVQMSRPHGLWRHHKHCCSGETTFVRENITVQTKNQVSSCSNTTHKGFSVQRHRLTCLFLHQHNCACGYLWFCFHNIFFYTLLLLWDNILLFIGLGVCEHTVLLIIRSKINTQICFW